MSAGANGLKLTHHVWCLHCDLQDGATALMFAAQGGHDAVVKTLLQRDAVVDHVELVGFVKRDSICYQQATLHSVGSLFACSSLLARMPVLVSSNAPVICYFAL